MLMADTVMDADEPRFQIGEDEMDDRHESDPISLDTELA